MKSTLKAIGLMVVGGWFLGLSLYYGKKLPILRDVADQVTEGFIKE